MNRVYKNNFYKNLFERELKFLKEFFDKTRVKNGKSYKNALKKIDNAMI